VQRDLTSRAERSDARQVGR